MGAAPVKRRTVSVSDATLTEGHGGLTNAVFTVSLNPSFGDAAFYGSTGNIRLNQPIVGMAPVLRTVGI